eukprot:4767314-Prymnesium_polylepis.2
MQSGCPLAPELRSAILMSIDQDRAAHGTNAHSRRVVLKLFRLLVEEYDGTECIWYRSETFLELLERCKENQRNDFYFRTEGETIDHACVFVSCARGSRACQHRTRLLARGCPMPRSVQTNLATSAPRVLPGQAG